MRRLVRLALAAVLLLAGCAAGEPGEDPGAGIWEDYQPPALAEEAEEPSGPEYPAAFSLACHRGQTLDPIDCGQGMQEDVSSLLFEPLFQLDESFQPIPLLCESYEWDETGLVCTLTLRQEAAFHDGSPLTAADVAATLRRAMVSERYAYRLRGVAAVAADRSGRVRITLTAPNRGLPALLDIPIVKSGTEALTAPVGTGPYRLSEDGGSLIANESWWQGRAMPVSVIPLVHAKDRDTAKYLFSSKRVQLLTVDPTDDLSSVTGQLQSTARPTPILQFIGFNTGEGALFASPALRAAFSRGIPRDTLVSAQQAGLALAASFPVSPLSPLYPADLVREYDRDETLAALRAAGQDTGQTRELVLLVNEEDRFRLTSAQFIAEHLSLLDWHITVRQLPWEDYLAALAAGEFDLYYGEVRLTADWDLRDLTGTGGALNYGGYTASYTDLLLENFLTADNRPAAARQLLAHLQDACPIAPICFKNDAVLTHPGVAENLTPTASSAFYRMDRWTVRLSE